MHFFARSLASMELILKLAIKRILLGAMTIDANSSLFPSADPVFNTESCENELNGGIVEILDMSNARELS